MRVPRRCVPPTLLVVLLAAACGDTAGPTTTPTAAPDPPAPTDPTAPTTTTAPGPPATTAPDPSGAPASGVVETLAFEVVATHPHDPTAFTQGLVVARDGRLFESTGLYGASDVREVDLATGVVIRSAELADDEFGEGLALVDDRLVQLTWREETALVWEADDLDPVGTIPYEGEGWGLCDDGSRLVMSDGSARLAFRDRGTFAVVGAVDVALDGAPVERLNELECVDGDVWANVWQTDRILRIDPAAGAVTGVLDITGLLDRTETPGADVLNGIAYRTDTGTFLLTGKLWPTVFEVRIGPAA